MKNYTMLSSMSAAFNSSVSWTEANSVSISLAISVSPHSLRAPTKARSVLPSLSEYNWRKASVGFRKLVKPLHSLEIPSFSATLRKNQ